MAANDERSEDAAPDPRRGTFDFLTPIAGPELVIGLVAPIGTDLTKVRMVLEEELTKVNYGSQYIHITDLFSDIPIDLKLRTENLETKYRTYIQAGNTLRERTKRQDILALLTVGAIRNRRSEISEIPGGPAPYTAYILSQFKRPEEIETLRKVYGKAFIQISAYCSKSKRLDVLTRRIAQSYYHKLREDAYRGKAYDLINTDIDEEENDFGQRVRDTFPLADVIINAGSEDDIRKTCSRFIRAFFGDNFVTPTKDEYGAYAAKSASLRSSDLSRQVGAVIMTPGGEIVATGCNEVPKALGGTYWEDGDFDFRDFVQGEDPSVSVKRKILEDTFRRLKGGWLARKRSRTDISQLVEEALFSNDAPIMKGASLMDILEFGRVIHAEMSAICDAARLGESVKGAILYCTTFPCHICARHIIASGIKRVVYIEPYSKSLAADLYFDSIEVDGERKSEGPKVRLESFVGIAPARYGEIFAKGKRKDDRGKATTWVPQSAKPIIDMMVAEYLRTESAVTSSLSRIFEDLKSKSS